MTEPCPDCGCPSQYYDGHVCEDYAAKVSLREFTEFRENLERRMTAWFTPSGKDIERCLAEIDRLQAVLGRITKLSPSAEYAGSNAVFLAKRALGDE